MNTFILGIILFFFGTIIGSFLNVVIYRFNSGKTLGGRSMCFSCGKTLHWHELIPMASFLVQGGKCTKCRSIISFQYPIVEGVTGLLFMLLAFHFLPLLLSGSVTLFLIYLTFFTYLWGLWLVISVYDIRHTIIPERLVWMANILALLSLFFFKHGALVITLPDLWAILAGPVLASPFWFFWYISKGKWMGLGDAKLMLGIGWLLGLGTGFVGMLFAFWIGLVVSVILLVFKRNKYTVQSEIPFGPFLVLGAFLAWSMGLDVMSLAFLFA